MSQPTLVIPPRPMIGVVHQYGDKRNWFHRLWTAPLPTDLVITATYPGRTYCKSIVITDIDMTIGEKVDLMIGKYALYGVMAISQLDAKTFECVIDWYQEQESTNV